MENDTLSEIRKRTKASNEILGKNIRKKRIEQNISQEYLAEILDISRQSISKWENGVSLR